MNQQPWHYIVATRDQPDAHGRLAACLSDANALWAPRAPVLMLSVAKQTFDADEQPNRFAWHDTGLATAGLMIQATALGLHVHAMGGFSRMKARELFGIPASYDPVAAIAMGYLGEPDSLPEDLRDAERAPRSRRPCKTWVFAETWGRASPLVD
jgi:nitroreductase